jgi:hypothetical protein
MLSRDFTAHDQNFDIVTHTTSTRQHLCKHVPELTQTTTERHLKAVIVKSEYTSIARQRLARTYPSGLSALLPRSFFNSCENFFGGCAANRKSQGIISPLRNWTLVLSMDKYVLSSEKTPRNDKIVTGPGQGRPHLRGKYRGPWPPQNRNTIHRFYLDTCFS